VPADGARGEQSAGGARTEERRDTPTATATDRTRDKGKLKIFYFHRTNGSTLLQQIMKKALRETQTLRARWL